MTETLDACAPVRTITRRCTHDNRQLFADVRAAKRACRRAELRFWAEDHAALNLARTNAGLQINKSRTRFITDELIAPGRDPRKLWRTTNRLLHRSSPVGRDDSKYALILVTFCQVFTDKINSLLKTLQSVIQLMPVSWTDVSTMDSR